MTVHTVLFCHCFEVRTPGHTGRLPGSSIGNCFTELRFDTVPARYGPVAVAIGFSVGPEDVGIDQTVRVALIGPDGAAPAPPHLPSLRSYGDSGTVPQKPLAFDYQVHISSLDDEAPIRWQQINLKNLYFRSYGLCRCEITINGVLSRSETLAIRPRSQGERSSPPAHIVKPE